MKNTEQKTKRPARKKRKASTFKITLGALIVLCAAYQTGRISGHNDLPRAIDVAGGYGIEPVVLGDDMKIYKASEYYQRGYSQELINDMNILVASVLKEEI